MDASKYFTEKIMLDAATAIDREDLPRLASMARSGLDVNRLGVEGFTLIIYALGNRRYLSARELLRLGANPNQKTQAGLSAVSLSAGSDDPQLLRITLEGGGDPNILNERNQPVTFTAGSQQRWENLMYLLDRGARLDDQDSGGKNILHELSIFNQYQVVADLIERGANPLSADHGGRSIAHRVQGARVDPASPQGKGLERVKKQLEARGIRFPVPPPRVRK